MRKKLVREGLFSLTFEYSFKEYDSETVKYYFEYANYDKYEKSYIEESIDEIHYNLDRIDSYIAKYLKGWTIGRLYKIDLAILRVAVYELLIEKVTAKEIIANEAVELAKRYGTDDSSGLINGVIGTIIRSEEIA